MLLRGPSIKNLPHCPLICNKDVDIKKWIFVGLDYGKIECCIWIDGFWELYLNLNRVELEYWGKP